MRSVVQNPSLHGANLCDGIRRWSQDSGRMLYHGGAWRNEQEWPLQRAQATEYFLQPGGGLATTKPPANGGKIDFVFNPADPVPTIGGNISSAMTYYCKELGINAVDRMSGTGLAPYPCRLATMSLSFKPNRSLKTWKSQASYRFACGSPPIALIQTSPPSWWMSIHRPTTIRWLRSEYHRWYTPRLAFASH